MAKEWLAVVEVDPFAARAARAGLGEEEASELIVHLARHPEAGDLIPGTSGLRKLRWAGKGKGKRGGYRVIYYFLDRGVPLFLLAVYPKSQQADLAPDQKKQLTALAVALKAEARKGKDRKGKRTG